MPNAVFTCTSKEKGSPAWVGVGSSVRASATGLSVSVISLDGNEAEELRREQQEEPKLMTLRPFGETTFCRVKKSLCKKGEVSAQRICSGRWKDDASNGEGASE